MTGEFRLRFLQRPLVVGGAAMRGEKAAAMFPEHRPNELAVGLGQGKRIELRARKKFKAAFANGRRGFAQARENFEQKNQPVRLASVTVLADEAGEMQICGRDAQADFFRSFAASAGVGRLAFRGVKLAAAGAP